MELPFDNLVRVYIRPALSGRLFPMGLIVFAYLLGPALFGWYGVFLGPLLMVVVVLFLQLKLPRLLRPSRAEGPLGPIGRGGVWGVDADPEQVRLGEVRAGVEESGPTD